MSESELHPDTRAVHATSDRECEHGATSVPIFQSAAFAYRKAEELEAVFAGREAGYVYSRIANPTVAHFERRVAELEGGLGAVACASGMAAISAAALGLAGAGDEIVAGNSLFGGTYSLFKQTLSRYGIVTRFVETTDVDAYRRAINDRTKLVFLETMGNPKLDIPDIAAIAAVTRETGVALVVDNTVTTPLLLQPKTLGADLVVHSTSKFINGHGNAIGGILVDCGAMDWSSRRYAHLAERHRRVREFAFLAFLRNQVCRDLGWCLSPTNAFLMEVGVDSLAVRMERHCSNALAVARHFAGDGRVAAVRYPGLPDHPDHGVARRQFQSRFGALMTLRLGDKERCFRFVNGLRLARNLANIGDTRTLAIHPASTICRDLSDEERRMVGVSEDLVRLSIGIEHPDDIIGDMDRSLGSV